MRKLVLIVALAVLFPVMASAAPLKWHGTLKIDLGTLPSMIINGSGIGTVNNSTGYGHLNNAIIIGGLTASTGVPVTDPEVTQANGIVRVEIDITANGTPAGFQTFGNISGGPPLNPNQYGIAGVAKICLYDPNCNPGGFLPLALQGHGTASSVVGAGIGGLLSIGGFGGIRISIINNPWTIGNAQALDQTDGGNFVNRTTNGFAHGPASLTTSTAKPSGTVQFVTPLQISTNLTTGSNELIGTFQVLTMHFIPEPGMLLLLGSGVAGLVLLGRNRMKRK
jgi:hypothetical protein